MLLDLSGLTREERVMVQASIGNERDFDRVADALIIQHQRKAKSGSSVMIIQTLAGFAEKANTLAAENLEQVLITRTSLPLKITMMIKT